MDILNHLVKAILSRHAKSNHCLVVGVNGAQGSGKTTISHKLKESLEKIGKKTVVISIDDFYLTKSERKSRAAKIHPLFLTRGVPGTHDVLLAFSILLELKSSTPSTHFFIPQFDKAVDDRQARSKWLEVEGSVDIVLFEGWCVGAVPEPDEALMDPVNNLESNEDPERIWRTSVNKQLHQHYQQLFSQIDFLIMLKVESFDAVYHHRLEQEQSLLMKHEGVSHKGIMSPEAVKRFILHYQRLTEWMLKEMPARADILVGVDCDRNYQLIDP